MKHSIFYCFLIMSYISSTSGMLYRNIERSFKNTSKLQPFTKKQYTPAQLYNTVTNTSKRPQSWRAQYNRYSHPIKKGLLTSCALTTGYMITKDRNVMAESPTEQLNNNPLGALKEPSLEYDTYIPERVLITHAIGGGGTIESVNKHGLLTHNELYKQGLIQKQPQPYQGSLFANQYKVIYFSYDPSTTRENSVSLEVNPYTTYVYNREFRYYNALGEYNASKIPLATFILNERKAAAMKKIAPPDKVVIYHPITAEPFYVDNTDKRYHNPNPFMMYGKNIWTRPSIYQYFAEVIIPKDRIPPEELIFPK